MVRKDRIPLVDLSYEHGELYQEINRAISEVIHKGYFSLGKQVDLFEQEFADYLGVKSGIGVASGTDALMLSLRALGVENGDEVVVPANSYPTAFAVAAVTKNIKLVDIDPATFTIDPLALEKSITAKTRAIVVVHLYGLPADMDSIMQIAKRHGVSFIEDCAQAHGATYQPAGKASQGKKAGSLGELGCFSFYPTKNLGAFGDGGMVVTNNRSLAERIRMLRMYGERLRYQSEMLGFNSRLDELQAAILRVKLTRLDKNNIMRKQIAQTYFRELKGVDLILPSEPQGRNHVYHLFVVRTKNRDRVVRYLEKHGVETGVHFPYPIHLVKTFAYLNYKFGDFPQAEKASREILSLPCYPGLTETNIRSICNLIKNVLS